MAEGRRRSAEPGRTEARGRGVAATTLPLVFFDGECGLCNRIVRWLLKKDRRRILRFAPLQSETATHMLEALPSDPAEWSIVFRDDTATYRESDAALRAVAAVGGPWRLARWLLLVPRVIRDGLYRLVARNRVRWFGRVGSCELLSTEDRERLLP